MKFTVVTVCFNAADTIEKTIKSVLNQTHNDIEYIIKDGASRDETMDVVNSYVDDKRIIAVSSPDNGLYNAMNEAIDMASGEYIIFMNAGDCFASTTVLADVANMASNAEFIYGNVIRKKPNSDELEKYGGRKRLLKLLFMGRMVSHQSMIVRTDVMKKYHFDESFKITADYNLYAKLLKNKHSMQHIDTVVSVVENIEGISSQSTNLSVMRAEDDRTLKEYYPVFYYLLKPIKGIKRRFL